MIKEKEFISIAEATFWRGKKAVKLLQFNVKWISTVISEIYQCFVCSSASSAKMADFTSVCQE
jgi:hypothetical protein